LRSKKVLQISSDDIKKSQKKFEEELKKNPELRIKHEKETAQILKSAKENKQRCDEK